MRVAQYSLQLIQFMVSMILIVAPRKMSDCTCQRTILWQINYYLSLIYRPDSLLSRFDLLFIVLDNIDTELDRQLADHILGSHQYRRPGQDMTPEPLNADMHLHSTFNEVLGRTIYCNSNKFLYECW